jgi:hypothetical protein
LQEEEIILELEVLTAVAMGRAASISEMKMSYIIGMNICWPSKQTGLILTNLLKDKGSSYTLSICGTT